MLNNLYDLRLGSKKVIYTNTIKRHNLGKYYFVANVKPFQLVTNMPDTSKNKQQGNALVFGAWGYARDPMLREFRLNLDPKSGLVLRHQCLFIDCLFLPLNILTWLFCSCKQSRPWKVGGRSLLYSIRSFGASSKLPDL